jgi:sugar lactone lactonase YvrE
MTAEVILDAADIVGESIVYDDRRDALLWVDIGGKRIHRLFLNDHRRELWPTPDFPTSIGLRADGGAIVGLRDRVSLWDYGDEFRTLVVVEPDLPDNRLNEGRVGPDGAFWVGTMQNNLQPDGSPKEMTRDSGALYRVEPDGEVIQLTPREFGIANTMAWTADGRFLTADTARNMIYTYDLVGGALKNKHALAAKVDRGVPTALASILTDVSGTVGSAAGHASPAFGRMAVWTGWSTCLAAGRQVARSGAPALQRYSSRQRASR